MTQDEIRDALAWAEQRGAEVVHLVQPENFWRHVFTIAKALREAVAEKDEWKRRAEERGRTYLNEYHRAEAAEAEHADCALWLEGQRQRADRAESSLEAARRELAEKDALYASGFLIVQKERDEALAEVALGRECWNEERSKVEDLQARLSAMEPVVEAAESVASPHCDLGHEMGRLKKALAALRGQEKNRE